MKQWGMMHAGLMHVLFYCDMKYLFCFTESQLNAFQPSACVAVSHLAGFQQTTPACPQDRYTLAPIVIPLIVLVKEQTTQEIIGAHQIVRHHAPVHGIIKC